MTIEASVLISGGLILASVVGSHVALRTEFKTSMRFIEEDVREIKAKVLNGHFVRRSECSHCQQNHEEN